MTQAQKQKVVVIVSGGMDSVTLAHYARKSVGVEPVLLAFDYGQKHRRELDCMRQCAVDLQAAFSIIDIRSFNAAFANSALVSKNVEVPNIISTMGDPQPPTYVPFRNMIFLSIAAAFAETQEARYVYYGAQKHDLYCLDEQAWVVGAHGGPLQLRDAVEGMEILDLNGDVTSIKRLDWTTVPVHMRIEAGGAWYNCTYGHDVPIVQYDVSSNDGKSWVNHQIKWLPAEHVQAGMFTAMPLETFDTVGEDLTSELELKLWWVAEGTTNNRDAVVICQSEEANPENYERICTLIEACGYSPWKMPDRIAFTSAAQPLIEGLGSNSFDKRLPVEAFRLSRVASRQALEVLIRGDGYFRGRDAYYFTSSEQLAQDVIALALRAGVPAKPQQRPEGSNIAIHIPAFEPKRTRPRSFRDFQALEITAAFPVTQELRVARMQTASGTFLGGNRGLLSQSNGYWDTTQEFVTRMNEVLNLNRKNKIGIVAPFVELSKAGVLRVGTEIGVDYSKTWSCYQGSKVACGTCPTCAERLKAFEECNLVDPLEYGEVN